MNEDKRIPFNLKFLDTCLPDYFQGFGGPVIAFPVDASMTYSELVSKLTDDDAWPESADIEDVRSAVTDLVGNVHSVESRPFHNIGPDAPPSTHFVSQHPTIHGMWMVIDKDDGEVMSSWPTEIEANIAAWGETGEERPADVYAYFGIELEMPEGYEIRFVPIDQDAPLVNQMPYWQPIALSYRGTGKAVALGGFDAEIEAKVAAWKDHLSNSEPAEFVAGCTDVNDERIWTSGIDHKNSRNNGSDWLNRIEVHGATEEESRELRDRILKALND